MDNQIGEIDTGARGKPSLSFETSTSTWKNMARIAVLCNSAEFAESAADADRGKQVWSLTQFYSVDFSQSRIGVKSAFSTNAQSRFVSNVVDDILGPPFIARHT